MMDNRFLGKIIGGFEDKNSSRKCHFSASMSYSDAAAASQNTQRSSHFPTHHNNTGSPVVKGEEKKKRVSKIIGGGLRQFSIMVCKKVESKGRTTYSEVADEIIAEFAATHINTAVSLDESDEKNVRRRVYDALNVLMALDIIGKEKKDIHWKGLPSTNVKYMDGIKELHAKLMTRIGKKETYVKDLEEQISGLQNLMQRNQQLLKTGRVPPQGFSLPFILVQTSPQATVEIEISDDMQLVRFDFNSTPFSLHDDANFLKLMRCYQVPESRHVSQSSLNHSSSSCSDIASAGTKPFYWNSEADTLR